MDGGRCLGSDLTYLRLLSTKTYHISYGRPESKSPSRLQGI